LRIPDSTGYMPECTVSIILDTVDVYVDAISRLVSDLWLATTQYPRR